MDIYFQIYEGTTKIIVPYSAYFTLTKSVIKAIPTYKVALITDEAYAF